jgi:molybdopterin-containing oxidoreductase family iron-sulfur binding subunit
VRRFNFFQFADFDTPSRKLGYNPDVTVRSRGVMEKCSYCVQRIRAAEIEAEKEQREVRDGEILTACQAACPAQAIVFGDIEDRKSTVRRWKDSPLSYALLADLNTEPRTTYLAALRNPNPEMEA